MCILIVCRLSASTRARIPRAADVTEVGIGTGAETEAGTVVEVIEAGADIGSAALLVLRLLTSVQGEGPRSVKMKPNLQPPLLLRARI